MARGGNSSLESSLGENWVPRYTIAVRSPDGRWRDTCWIVAESPAQAEAIFDRHFAVQPHNRQARPINRKEFEGSKVPAFWKLLERHGKARD